MCLTILNCWSVKWSSRFHTFLTGFKLVPLVVIVVGGIYNMAIGRVEHLESGFAPIEVIYDFFIMVHSGYCDTRKTT